VEGVVEAFCFWGFICIECLLVIIYAGGVNLKILYIGCVLEAQVPELAEV